MKRGILFLLWVFILLFSIATFYVSYSAYLQEREKRIAENLSTFLLSYPNKELVPLPYPELMVIKVKEDGKIFASANFASPIDYGTFLASLKRSDKKNVEVYIKKPSFDGFTFFLFENPIFLAMNLFLFILYLAFYYLLVKELEKPIPVEIKEEKPKTESEALFRLELVKRLKALKVLLHTEKILGKEATEKARNLVDEMLEKLENK